MCSFLASLENRPRVDILPYHRAGLDKYDRLGRELQQADRGFIYSHFEAATLRELLDAIAARFPAARPQLDRGVSVAIDGRLHTDDWFAPIDPQSEVVLLPKITGG